MPKEETIEIINRENDPCETCGYAEGSPFCLQYCPYDAERKKEQEPSDAISREAVLSLWGLRLSDKEIYMAIHDMPPVTPSRRKGHWIKTNSGYECSECAIESRSKSDFCQYCSAEMVEPQEGEEV